MQEVGNVESCSFASLFCAFFLAEALGLRACLYSAFLGLLGLVSLPAFFLESVQS